MILQSYLFEEGERNFFGKNFFVLAPHSSIPVRREVGRQAGYCSLRELFLSIYSIRRSMTKTFMCYDVFRSVL